MSTAVAAPYAVEPTGVPGEFAVVADGQLVGVVRDAGGGRWTSWVRVAPDVSRPAELPPAARSGRDAAVGVVLDTARRWGVLR